MGAVGIVLCLGITHSIVDQVGELHNLLGDDLLRKLAFEFLVVPHGKQLDSVALRACLLAVRPAISSGKADPEDLGAGGAFVHSAW